MKRLPKKVGILGLGLCTVGTAFAILAVVLARTNPMSSLGSLLMGSAIYLVGGFFVAGHFGYTRGAPAYLWLMGFRLVFAVCAMLAVVGSVTGGRV